MNRTSLKLTGVFAALLSAIALAPNLTAECGGYHSPHAIHSSWQSQSGEPRLLSASLETEDALSKSAPEPAFIVGLWHVKFVTKDTHGVPDGTEIDAGYSVWHSDNTEIMNSGGRSPITGDFCLGVWKQYEPNKYVLNHFAAGWDDTGSHLIGPANIREYVTLSPNKDEFTGTFTIDQFDESGNKLVHLQGIITGTRIGVGTAATSVF